jgi:hypothetical protein
MFLAVLALCASASVTQANGDLCIIIENTTVVCG